MSANTPKGYNTYGVQQFTPEMMRLFQQFLGKAGQGAGSGLDFLSKLASGDEDIFNQIEAPAYASLEKGLGQTANRFSQFGAQGSSAFQNALSGQSADMAQNLASQRTNIMTSAIDKLLGQSNQLLNQKPIEYGLQEKETDPWVQLIQTLGPLLAKFAASRGN